MSETAFPITTRAFRRFRRAWHLYWIGRHIVATIEHLEKLGSEGEAARLAIIDAYLRDVPVATPPSTVVPGVGK